MNRTNMAQRLLVRLITYSLPVYLASNVMADVPDEKSTDSAPQTWAWYGQFTNVTQRHNVFKSPYTGANSLHSDGPMEETSDFTLYAGVRPWHNAEFWVNPEVDQGFGLDNTLGLAGYASGEAYKLGNNVPYLRLPRAFLRQTINLGGESQKLDATANQLSGATTANNIVVTLGKFSVADIFDTNRYAHDPRGDFLNWSLIDGGAFDYAADPWGFTFGGAVEWTQDWWTVRAGYFELSKQPNSKAANFNFSKNSPMLELEGRYQLFSHPGKVKLLAYEDRADMGRYLDAVNLGQQTNTTPDTAQVRRFATKAGFVVNLEQELSSSAGIFARYSKDDGSKEAYEFTDINRSVSAGVSINGDWWKRHDDTIGLAGVVNSLSNDARTYFSAGGLGILIGDGKLNYGQEKIGEMYYSAHFNEYFSFTLDYQHVVNPAYNRDRGPVNLYASRIHVQF